MASCSGTYEPLCRLIGAQIYVLPDKFDNMCAGLKEVS
jgi:hypothetical protein